MVPAESYPRMKTYSPESPIVQPKAFLFLGPPGSGKTIAALGFPGLYLADCDLNLEGPTRLLSSVNQAKPFAYDQIPFEDDGKTPVRPAMRWPRLLAKIDAAKADKSIQTICIDSLSHLNEYLISYVGAKQGREMLALQDWPSFVNELVRLILSIRTSGKHFILTCHEVCERDNKGEITAYTPNVSSSKCRDSLAAFFTDVYRFYSYPGAGGRPSFRIATMRTSTSEGLKNTLQLPPEIIIPPGHTQFQALQPYLKNL